MLLTGALWRITYDEASGMSGDSRQSGASVTRAAGSEAALPEAWRDFIRFCRELRHGDIERLRIQDGVPVLAEMTRKKVRFPKET
ncbi:MAG TPA: hypothetical protein VFA04_17535 [Bryobacteraceae bacterium]|jgi:hypothetical protein|nr:hypothetical protein [Bryobacteraceae bacterium]